jgi:hypothetical protein
MSLFDLFSGKSGRQAAMANAQLAQNNYGQLADLMRMYTGWGQNALQAAQPQQLAALGQGYQTAQQQFGAASDLYNPYRDVGLQAWGAQADAAGLNGQGGYDRATARFRESPGYQFRVNEMTNATTRGAAAGGQLLSGNTLAALQERGKGLADQEWNADYARLSGLADRGYDATGAQAGIAQNLGRVGYQYGGDVAGVYGGTARSLADLWSGAGRTQAAALSDMTQQQLNANNQAFQAGQDANKNVLNFGLGIGSSLASLGGAFLGGPTGQSRLRQWGLA